jgi:hypothetical protein
LKNTNACERCFGTSIHDLRRKLDIEVFCASFRYTVEFFRLPRFNGDVNDSIEEISIELDQTILLAPNTKHDELDIQFLKCSKIEGECFLSLVIEIVVRPRLREG